MAATLLAVRQLKQGATSETLRTNASGVVVWDSFLKNTGTEVAIGNPTSITTGIPLQVWGTGGSASLLGVIEKTSANNSAWISIQNDANADQLAQLAVIGTADDFITGTTQKDVLLRVGNAAKRLWFGGATTMFAGLNSTGLIIGGVGTPGARLDVIAGSGLAGLFTGVSGQVGVRIVATSATPALDITNTGTRMIDLTSSASMSSTSGALIIATTSAAASASGQRYGGLTVGKNITGTIPSLGSILLFSEEDNTTNRGAKMQFAVGTLGATTTLVRVEFRGNGQVCLAATGSEAATSATTDTVLLPTRNGLPTGVPAFSYTGAADAVIDRANNRLYIYTNAAWNNVANAGTNHHVHNTATYTPGAGGGTDTLAVTTDIVLCDTTSGVQTINLPTIANRGLRPIAVKRKIGSASNVTISAGSGNTIDGGASITLDGTAGKKAVVLFPVGTDWQAFYGAG